MKNINLIITLFVISGSVSAQIISQKVGDNPTLISNSAVLEVESTNKGVLIPRIALTSATDSSTINSPATSLFIYNTATAGTSPNNVTPGFYYWGGVSWIRMATGNALLSEVDGVIGNEVTDAVANGGLTRLGTGTAADPYKLKINDGTVNGQILTWDGSKWVAQAVPAEVDGVIGNEVTDAVTNGGLTRLGAGTAADPYKLKINDGSANGQLLTWDGSKWVAQAASSDWTITGNAGTDPNTNFIGTTDAKDFVFKANSSEVMRISNANGRLGIGTTTPSSSLHINGSFAMPLINVNSNVTLTASNAVVNVNTSAGDVTITLPAASTALNRIYSIIKSDSSTNKLIFSATINGNGFTFTQVNIPGEYKIQSNGTNWILVN